VKKNVPVQDELPTLLEALPVPLTATQGDAPSAVEVHERSPPVLAALPVPLAATPPLLCALRVPLIAMPGLEALPLPLTATTWAQLFPEACTSAGRLQSCACAAAGTVAKKTALPTPRSAAVGARRPRRPPTARATADVHAALRSNIRLPPPSASYRS
jgi:hypothetical protein